MGKITLVQQWGDGDNNTYKVDPKGKWKRFVSRFEYYPNGGSWEQVEKIKVIKLQSPKPNVKKDK